MPTTEERRVVEQAPRASDPLLASYEEVPYAGSPVSTGHPDALATVATLYGMSPSSVESCRVLELGCATGGNLVAMALSLPDASFVGVDLAPRQIAAAKALTDRVGLANVELRAMSIAAIDDRFGTFDYIVCHGVYSWVPRAVQDAILRVCSRNLAPNGVAYVSYNTYPGWHIRAMLREMILFHDDPAASPPARIARGRELVEFLARYAATDESLYRVVLQRELTTLQAMADSHFLHEELEVINEPLWFAEFAQRAAAHDLQILGEAGLSMDEAVIPADARTRLRSWASDAVRYEQYLDFLVERTFRRTLLCHAAARRTAVPTADAVPRLYATARAVPVSPAADPRTDVTEEFRAPTGHVVTAKHPLVRAALHILHEAAPNALSFADLWARVRVRAGECDEATADEGARRALAEALVECASAHLVLLHVRPTPCASEPGHRPTATPLARVQAASGSMVTNMRHYSVELSDIDRLIVAHLDGTRARSDILDVVRQAAARGPASAEDAAVPSDAELASALDARLRRLARSALLVS